MTDDRHSWPWPTTGRLLASGPLPERFPGQYAPEMKAEWQPWIDAARSGASIDRLKELEPRIEQEHLRRPLGSRERAVGRVPEAVRDMELDALIAALRRRGLRAVRWPRNAVAPTGDDPQKDVA